jgi:hypothetical protein
LLLSTVHLDEGEISISRSTKIDAFDCGVCFANSLSLVSCGDASFVSMTSLRIVGMLKNVIGRYSNLISYISTNDSVYLPLLVRLLRSSQRLCVCVFIAIFFVDTVLRPCAFTVNPYSLMRQFTF